jgi:hypothetical protein
MKNSLLCFIACTVIIMAGCVKIKHDMTIQPVHVTVEIRVKIDRALEDFFSDIDNAESTGQTTESQEKEKTNQNETKK